MDETEMALLAASDTSIAICTESNLKLASGIAPLSRYQKQGVRCCFGTDGVASNNNLDLLTELDFTAKLHKAVNNDPTMLPAEQMLRMATIEAARALHRDTDLGSLEVGKKADLVVLDCCSIEAQPMYNPYSQVIYALGSKAVRDVLINGEFVLKDRQLTRLDEAEIISTAKHYQQIIMEELKR
jgi:5-methylthioadenosine/S-adenosylhomocysteine deaminase